MERSIHFQDNSGDKKYFTIIPNYIANHSTANDQALYFQMKRYAGENGQCFASKNTLRKKLGIGKKAVNKSIAYLLEHKWIALLGVKMVMTAGGPQAVDIYSVNDIWKMNNDFYEGGLKRTPLSSKGVPKDSKVVSKGSKGGPERAPNKNNYKEPEEDNLFSIIDIDKFRPEFIKKPKRLK